jgi:hypothetical protein
MPKPWFKFIDHNEDGMASVDRQNAKIHITLKSLRDICLWRLIFLVKSKSDVHNLDLPLTIKKDLLHLFYLSTRFNETDKSPSPERQ